MSKNKNKIFNDDLINFKTDNFDLKQLSNFNQIKDIIINWNENVKSNRVILENEVGIKGQFINDIFGTVLGFNFTNAYTSHLRHELKTQLDGTKPDAVLGYFYSSTESKEIENDVRVIIEMKHASTNLDEIQNRINQKITPVDQAFQYSYKMYNGKCRWVVVSNFLEIRFYKSNFQGEYEIFLLKDLLQDDVLKRFIYLFHIDRLLDREISVTERLYEKNKNYKSKSITPSFHIVDEMFESLKKFEGLTFIPPQTIANIKPFNILEDYVWHYDNFSLFTLNNKIYEFLNNIEVNGNNIIINPEYEDNLKRIVDDYLSKIKHILKLLNHSFIHKISAINNLDKIKAKKENGNVIGFSLRHPFDFSKEDGKKFNILLSKDSDCDCYICNFYNFQFNKLLGKIKSNIGNPNCINLEFAYVNYLMNTNNYKETYLIYRQIVKNTKGKEGKEIEYFIAKYNLKYLHNLLTYYSLEDKQEILNDIKIIDLDKVIGEELETTINPDTRHLLLDIKEKESISRVEKELDNYLLQLEKIHNYYKTNWSERQGTNYLRELNEILYYFYFYYNTNFIIGNAFTNYEDFAFKILKGFILSYQSTNYEYRLKKFKPFYLTHSIIHIHTSKIEELFNKYDVDVIKLDELKKTEMITTTKNLLESRFEVNRWGINSNKLMDEFLILYPFTDSYTKIFSNTFLFLTKIEFNQEQIDTIIPAILNFLKIEDELAWFDLKHLGNFILSKSKFIKPDDQFEILNIINERYESNSNKYDNLFNKICSSLKYHHPDYKINSKKFLQRVHVNSINSNNKLDYNNLIPLYKILDTENQNTLLNIFKESLDKDLNFDFYDKLLRKEILDYNYKDYFLKYIEHINTIKFNGNYKLVNNKPQFNDYTFSNFIILIHILNVSLKDERLNKFSRLSNVEKWLLNPFEFDYKDFLPEWIFALENDFFQKNLKGEKRIEVAIKNELANNYNSDMAEIYFKYLL